MEVNMINIIKFFLLMIFIHRGRMEKFLVTQMVFLILAPPLQFNLIHIQKKL